MKTLLGIGLPLFHIFRTKEDLQKIAANLLLSRLKLLQQPNFTTAYSDVKDKEEMQSIYKSFQKGINHDKLFSHNNQLSTSELKDAKETQATVLKQETMMSYENQSSQINSSKEINWKEENWLADENDDNSSWGLRKLNDVRQYEDDELSIDKQSCIPHPKSFHGRLCGK